MFSSSFDDDDSIPSSKGETFVHHAVFGTHHNGAQIMTSEQEMSFSEKSQHGPWQQQCLWPSTTMDIIALLVNNINKKFLCSSTDSIGDFVISFCSGVEFGVELWSRSQVASCFQQQVPVANPEGCLSPRCASAHLQSCFATQAI